MAKQYFAQIDGEQRGPFTLEQLAEAGVGPDTYVWCKGMPDWIPARDDAEICRRFRRRLLDLKAGHADSELEPPSPQPSDPSALSPEEYEERLKDVPLRLRHFVRQSGQVPDKSADPEADYDRRPASMVVWAILAMVFFSFLLGIVALVYALKARSAWNRGEKERAWNLTRLAKMWVGFAVFIGLIINMFVAKYLGL